MPILDAQTFEASGWRNSFEFGAAAPLGNDRTLTFLNALSRAILTDKTVRAHPDLVTFGYFCRKANLVRGLQGIPSASTRFGWGTVVHIAPANIPLNFAFSFVMGLLSGNSNIVRLPSQPFAQTTRAVEIIDQVLADSDFRQIARQTRFVQTDRDSATLRTLVGDAAGLVVWGGDTTVAQFRALPKSPRCAEVYFPDRVSSLLVDAESYLALTEAELRMTARHFFNDTFLVDQNACSSPTAVFWLGADPKTILAAQERFWAHLALLLEAEYQLDPVARISRNLDLFRDVSTVGHALDLSTDHDVWRLEDPKILRLPLRFGTFLELPLRDVAQILDYLRPNEQTLTTLGITPEETFAQLTQDGRVPSFDRIVPVGKALEIGFNWDGKEVLSILSRRMQVSQQIHHA